MKVFSVLVLGIFLAISKPVKAEIAEIENASWQEVPGTFEPKAPESYRMPAFVDVNGVVRNGDVITFDIVDPHWSYIRSQINCRTYQARTIRMGFFESQTRINYQLIKSNWLSIESALQDKVFKFVCNL